MIPETDEQHLIRLLKLEQAVIKMVTERGDRICWRDLYTELAGLVGIEFTPALICDQKQFLANCKAFDDSLRTGGKYIPIHYEKTIPPLPPPPNNVTIRDDEDFCRDAITGKRR